MAPEEDIVVTVDYDAMTKAELQELCDAKGISYSRMSYKSTLVKLLKG
jgi:ribosomal protein L7Ae-like RNA K-turn-binding protein